MKELKMGNWGSVEAGEFLTHTCVSEHIHTHTLSKQPRETRSLQQWWSECSMQV